MDREPNAEEIRPENLPFYIEWPDEVYGEIVYAKRLCPGVYYLSTRMEGHPFGEEYYVVSDHAVAISKEARNYGTSLLSIPGIRLFEHRLDKGGKEIIEYEIEKYRLSHGNPPQKNFTLHGAAIYGMELYPQYFGEYPVPFVTPMGYTCRHKRIDNGVYWIETDRQKICIAVCFPYRDEFSSTAVKLAVQMDEDREKGLNQTLGYSFFSKEVCCIPVFELMEFRKWDAMINRAALMNAIWNDFPEYATAYNAEEQTGRHDMLGLLRMSLGDPDVKLRGSTKFVISMTPGAGVDFFRFQ